MAFRRIVLALAMLVVLALPGCEASEAERQQASLAASEAFAKRFPNGGCVGSADIFIDTEAVADLVEGAQANAGWIEEDSVFVGSFVDLARSVDASFATRAGREAWVLAERDGPRLLRLLEVGDLLKPAFSITSTQGPC